MVRQPYSEDEQQFMAETQLNNVETLLPAEPAIAPGTLDRIRQRTHAKIGAASQPTPRPAPRQVRRWPLWLSAAAAVIAIFVGAGAPLWHPNIVHAMEKAVLELSSYHGVIETSAVSRETGQPLPGKPRQLEIWWSRGRYVIQYDGGLQISDGEYTWQVSDQWHMAELQLTATSYDVASFTVQGAADLAMRYPYTVTGSETVAGRDCTKLTVTLPGGLPTYIWIDKATKLPVQVQRLSGPAVETTTFVNLAINPPIADERFQYQPPADYKVSRLIYQTPASLEAAAPYAGFTPLRPTDAPRRIYAIEGEVVLVYGDVTVIQQPSSGEYWSGASSFPQGSVGGNPLLVGPRQLQWHQDGVDVIIVGEINQATRLARQIAPGLTLPDPALDLVGAAQVKLPPDVEAAKQLQLQQDYRSPGINLDVAQQVAHWFVNGQSADPTAVPQNPAVPFHNMRTVADTGAQALVEAPEGPYARVYLQRLVRQDYSGVWSVVGYDPR